MPWTDEVASIVSLLSKVLKESVVVRPDRTLFFFFFIQHITVAFLAVECIIKFVETIR